MTLDRAILERRMLNCEITFSKEIVLGIKQAWFSSPVERPLNVRRKRAIVDPGWCLAFGFDLISI
jgi:hypothetical protein